MEARERSYHWIVKHISGVLKDVIGTQEDVERPNDDIIKILELRYASSFNKHKNRVLSAIAKRKREVSRDLRMQKLMKNDGATSSEEESSDDDDSDSKGSTSSSSQSSSKLQTDGNKATEEQEHEITENGDDGDEEEKNEATNDGEDADEEQTTVVTKRHKRANIRERHPITQNLIKYARTKKLDRLYMSYNRKRFGHLAGNCGALIEHERCPAFARTRQQSDYSLVFMEGSRLVAQPIGRGSERFVKALDPFHIYSQPIFGRFQVDRRKRKRSDRENDEWNVFQIAQLNHPSGAWFALRGKNQMTLCGLNAEEGLWEIRDLNEQWPTQPTDEPFIHLAPSLYEPGRIAVLKRRSMDIFDVHEAIRPESDVCLAPSGDGFTRCALAAHPCTFLLSTRKTMYNFDSRSPSKQPTNLFLGYFESETYIDSDILGFGRIPNRREELMIVTKSEVLHLDIRAPGRFLGREFHAIPFESCNKLHQPTSATELSFHPSGNFATIWSTAKFPTYRMVGPISDVPSLDIHSHRDRVLSGIPFDKGSSKLTEFRVMKALTPFDDLRGVNPYALRMYKLLPPKISSEIRGVFKRVRRSGVTQWSEYPPRFESLITASYMGSGKNARVCFLGRSFSNVIKRRNVLKDASDVKPVLMWAEYPYKVDEQ